MTSLELSSPEQLRSMQQEALAWADELCSMHACFLAESHQRERLGNAQLPWCTSPWREWIAESLNVEPLVWPGWPVSSSESTAEQMCLCNAQQMCLCTGGLEQGMSGGIGLGTLLPCQ